MEPSIYTLMATLEENHWWFTARRAIAENIIKQLDLPPVAKILDAGCGTGGNLAMLSRYGQVHAMEMDDQARQMANAKGFAQVLSGRLPDEVPYQQEQFDLIVLLDVLEHVEDDRNTLRVLGSLLKPGGCLFISVPAFPFLWSMHDEVHHHKRRYFLSELKSKLENAGLEIAYTSYFNTVLFPLIFGARQLGKLRANKRDSGDLAMPTPFINRLLFALFSSERFVLGRWSLPFGVSAMAIARKGNR
ncbi:MAG: type 12 methyltransferase [Gallionellales bacterium RIFCSPLOWO2_02_58_13]|nr:MAG: type 12 methyltransferase [Gallionellales bacterium RIFCSPLOWO2_02_58_13]